MLYQNNLLTPQEFLYAFPADVRIDPNSLNKLVFDMRPPIRDPMNLEEISKYFDEFRSIAKKTTNVLEDPFELV